VLGLPAVHSSRDRSAAARPGTNTTQFEPEILKGIARADPGTPKTSEYNLNHAGQRVSATATGASKGVGNGLNAPPRAARRARSLAVSRDRAVRAVTAAAAVPRSGLLEPGGGEHLLARGRQHVGNESLRDAMVAA